MSIVSQKKLKNNIYKLENCQFKVIEIFYGNKMKRNEIEDLLAEYYILFLFNIIFTTNVYNSYHIDKRVKEDFINHLYKTLESGFLYRSFNKVKEEKGPYLSAICNVLKKNKDQQGGNIGTAVASTTTVIMSILTVIFLFTTCVTMHPALHTLAGMNVEFNGFYPTVKYPKFFSDEEQKEFTNLKRNATSSQQTIKTLKAEIDALKANMKINEQTAKTRGYLEGKTDAIGDPDKTIQAMRDAVKDSIPQGYQSVVGDEFEGILSKVQTDLTFFLNGIPKLSEAIQDTVNEMIDDETLTDLTNTLTGMVTICNQSATITVPYGYYVIYPSTKVIPNPNREGYSEEDCKLIMDADKTPETQTYRKRGLLRKTDIFKRKVNAEKTPEMLEERAQDKDLQKETLSRAMHKLNQRGQFRTANFINSIQDSGTDNSRAIGTSPQFVTGPSQQSALIAGPLSGGKRKLKVTKRMKTMKKKNRRTKKRSN